METKFLIWHLSAFSIGILIDLIVGDPYFLPHPVRWIGSLIGYLDKKLLGELSKNKYDEILHNREAELIRGRILVMTVLLVTFVCTSGVLILSYMCSPFVGIIIEAVMTAYALAAKSLWKESMKVYHALFSDNIVEARKAVSMIVGRDTECLDEAGIIRATVETIAENTSDGVIAPLIYTFIGGPIAGLLYKAVNTCDSMIGYHNDRYEYFGRGAAKLDDIVNFVPARISALCMIISCIFLGNRFNTKGAIKIFKRDRFNHKSPNSAQTESVCAGALGVRLAGDASYFGKIVKKPTIGDNIREIDRADIVLAGRLMYGTEFAAYFVGLVIYLIIVFLNWK